MAPNMKKVNPLHLMSRKEKVKAESFMTRKKKVEDQVLFWIKRRRIFRTSSATYAIYTNTMIDIVMAQIKGSMKPQLQKSMKTLLTRSQGMMIVRSSSSSTPHVEVMI